MKNLNKNSIVKILSVVGAVVLVGLIVVFSAGKFGNNVSKKSLSASVYGAFVQANNFAILGGSTITNTGNSVITGDLGLSPGTAITGFLGTTENDGPGTISGTVNQTDPTATDAQTSLTTSYASVASQPCTQDLTGQDLGGLTLTPGVYCFSSSAGITGTLTLNAQDNPNAVFIFQIGSTLTTASGSNVTFTNNIGSSCNIFWQVGSSATLGSTSNFKGNIFALSAISTTNGSTVDGRLLARNGAVTLINTAVNAPVCEEPSTDIPEVVDNTTSEDTTPSESANDINATDITSDTVVELPVVSPLIHLTKIPNPLSLSAKGGIVTYTEKITNPGTITLSNVLLTDDKCNPVKYISGDINGDTKLDVNETWTYTCSSNLTKTTTNTATASGEANGITVKDFATATVVVSAPILPKTGFPPKENNNLSTD